MKKSALSNEQLKSLLIVFIISGLFMAGLQAIFNLKDGKTFELYPFVFHFFGYGYVFSLINYFTYSTKFKK